MDFTQLIQNVAFPIAACVAMGWYVVRQDDKHEKESQALKTAIDNNTVAIVKMIEKMEVK